MNVRRAKISAARKMASLAGILLFASLAFWLLGFYKAELLYRGQELNLFLFDGSFFLNHFTVPGGLLEYAGGFLRQFLADCEWGELDYLIVDMPPGTGDIQLSLAQLVPVQGAVMVTTPQNVFIADVYVTGYENNGAFDVAKVWKNGVATSLTNGSNQAFAFSIFVK